MKITSKQKGGLCNDIIDTIIDAHNNIDRVIGKLCLMYNNGTNECKECPLYAKETFFNHSTCRTADILDCLEFIVFEIENKMEKERYMKKVENND